MSHQLPTSHSHLQSSQHFLQLHPMLFPYYCPVPPQLSPSSSSNTASSTTTVDADSSTSSSSGAATPITHQHQQPLVHQLGNANVPCQPQQLPRLVSTSNNSGAFATPSAECITSVDNKNVNIELANKELWQKFHRVTNEMVVTRTGRKMFPKLELNLRGLDPNGLYSLTLCMRQLDTLRYKYQAGGWSPAGQDDSSATVSKFVNHHDAWNRGEFWMSQEKLCFDRVKLTNREMESNALISLCSMHKYQPVVHLYVMNEQGKAVRVCSFEPPATQFIAVTAYQSEAITRLKVEHNPFAKGFREGSSRKRTLSPSPISERNAPNDFPAGCPSVKRPLLCPSALFASPSAVSPFPMNPLYSSISTWHHPWSALFAASMAASSMSNGTSTSGYQQNNQMTELSKVYSRFWQQQQQQQQTSRSNGGGKDEQ